MPLAVGQAAEEPEALAGIGFDAPVIALHAGAAPPADLDPLWSPGVSDVVDLLMKVEFDRRTIRDDGNHVEHQWRRVERQGTL